MNKVYLDKDGNVFINGVKTEMVSSVSAKTNYLGTAIVLEMQGEYKCDYESKRKTHSLGERATK